MNTLIIPAAGRGTRLNYAGPKLLYPLQERPLIDYLLKRYAPYVQHFVIVINPQDESQVSHYLETTDYDYSLDYQQSPTGMLDAILAPMGRLKEQRVDQIWITWCDQVGITEQTAVGMQQRLQETIPPCLVMPTVKKSMPYIHLQRNQHGDIVAIRQRREGDEMPAVGENDCGLFGLSADTYFELLPRFAESVETGSGTRERNFLPFVAWLKGRALVVTYEASEPESIGVNTIEEAEQLLRLWNSRI